MPRTIKVVDRRRFTNEGEPRDGVPGDADSVSDTVASPSQESGAMKDRGHNEPRPEAPDPTPTPVETPSDNEKQMGETSPDFVELVVMLAQQAELLLVGAEGLQAQPDQARRMIDYLAALEGKTDGNLSEDEKQILSNAVFQLRTMFVQSR